MVLHYWHFFKSIICSITPQIMLQTTKEEIFNGLMLWYQIHHVRSFRGTRFFLLLWLQDTSFVNFKERIRVRLEFFSNCVFYRKDYSNSSLDIDYQMVYLFLIQQLWVFHRKDYKCKFCLGYQIMYLFLIKKHPSKKTIKMKVIPWLRCKHICVSHCLSSMLISVYR